MGQNKTCLQKTVTPVFRNINQSAKETLRNMFLLITSHAGLFSAIAFERIESLIVCEHGCKKNNTKQHVNQAIQTWSNVITYISWRHQLTLWPFSA